MTEHTTTGAVINGVPWYDDRGEVVNAHGSCLIRENGRYYLFGEYKTDAENHFIGFSCYSSADLVGWHFERMALPVQPHGILGPDRIGERVKVMKCPATERFIMLAHADNLTYTDPVIALAVSDTIDGEYRLLGALTCAGEPIRRWDMGTFQDADGTGYLLLHEGDIYRLAPDYLTAEELVARGVAPGGESPAMTHAEGTYFLMLSHKTSWDRNDNYYLTAPAPGGPWTPRGTVAPAGTRTWNSQCSYIVDGIYTGDRWSYPHQASSATYVWLPLTLRGGAMALLAYWQAWDPRTRRPVDLGGESFEVDWRSDVAGTWWSMPVRAGRIAVGGRSGRDGGYARIRLVDGDGNVAAEQLIDCYAPAPAEGLLYVGPPLPTGAYEATVEVTGEASVFYKKDGTRLGSTGTAVHITEIRVLA